MILAAHQPHYLPWLRYMAKVALARQPGLADRYGSRGLSRATCRTSTPRGTSSCSPAGRLPERDRVEGFGIVFREAGAADVPVVGCRHRRHSGGGEAAQDLDSGPSG